MLIKTHLLTKSYGELTALSDCTFEIPPGQVCGLLGPNGSGKTTLLRLLMGFLRPTAGTAVIDGMDCYRDRVRVHREVGYLPGEPRLFRDMRGRDVLRFFSEVHPCGNLDHSEEIAARLGMDLARQVARCSTGMRQKLAVAVMMSLDVPLLILDEPTANLDPSVRGEVIGLIREAREAGRTVIFSSHVLSEVEQVCQRVLMLRSGRLVHDQQMDQLRRRHRIHARLAGDLPAVPPTLEGRLTIVSRQDHEVVWETSDEITPLLDWLARVPLAEVRIEQVGLQTIYDAYHAQDSPRTTP
ncbi:MAG: ATP-binding cassette domain-containing protein [Planctomycetales bacterium]|nr:ATP-binding cassette domain-containing protein [Planctomycetales bacterium]NIM10068.1 ATP-binding cassette domain-containing protein [Planctomycetales bacterium]NIN09509.1 ATP-binding cassette domain-containing protein [Planctomycetales bacterium]NIN78620.1 ATP-binding cassette domain-containing protein [Planctomycetales bacterium]NIO35814.1 ATP-binding cassette domain-containing protein [Planctomycetales bacterium]